MKVADGTTVITGATMIDGAGVQPVPDAVVVMTDGALAYAGPTLIPPVD